MEKCWRLLQIWWVVGVWKCKKYDNIIKRWSYAFFTAVILCNFEDGMCDWKTLSDDKLYKFSRKKSEQLGNQDLPGPDGSVNDESTFFMYAGHKMAGINSTNGVTAQLKSPDFVIEEHPLECFSFWFFFGVSSSLIYRVIRLKLIHFRLAIFHGCMIF